MLLIGSSKSTTQKGSTLLDDYVLVDIVVQENPNNASLLLAHIIASQGMQTNITLVLVSVVKNYNIQVDLHFLVCCKRKPLSKI